MARYAYSKQRHHDIMNYCNDSNHKLPAITYSGSWVFKDQFKTARVNTFKNRLDRFWFNQDVLYDYTADLHGIGNRTVVI